MNNIKNMTDTPKKQDNTELNWVHVYSPDFLITTWVYNLPPEYFLTEDHDLKKDWPMSYIDYHISDMDYLNGILSIGTQEDDHWFGISNLDSTNKYSLEYFNCTWVIAIWCSKETKENISLLTHQDPLYFLSDKKSKENPWYTKKSFFEKSLEENLLKLKEKCEEWTIDIVILWWNNNDNFKEYKSSITLLSQVIKSIMCFYPVIVWWPSINEETKGNKWIYLDTKNRRLYYYKKYNNIENNIISVSTEIDSLLQQNNIKSNTGFFERIKKILKI